MGAIFDFNQIVVWQQPWQMYHLCYYLVHNNIHIMMFIHYVYQLIFDINENGVTNIITFILEMPSDLDWQYMFNMSQLKVKD